MSNILKYQNPSSPLLDSNTLTSDNIVNKFNQNYLFKPEQKKSFTEQNLTPDVPYRGLYRTYNWWDYDKKQSVKEDVPLKEENFKDITQDLKDGTTMYYPDSSKFRSGFTFYEPGIVLSDEELEEYYKDDPDRTRYYHDKNSNKYYKLYDSETPLRLSGELPDNFKEVSFNDLAKELPKRDYIGGNETEVALKVLDKLPGIKDYIKTKSEEYGINPNLTVHRMLQEGFLSKSAYDYNNASVKEQKNYNWEDVIKQPINGYRHFGLDTFGSKVKEGKVKLRNNIPYGTTSVMNEDGTGRIYLSAVFDDLYSAIEGKVATLEALQRRGKELGLSGEDLDVYTNAAYNRGENHPSLQNIQDLYDKYSVGSYYKKGGILKAQEGTGNGFWSKLWNAVKAGGMAARDAKIGAVGAQQVRDLYSEGKNQEAQNLAKQYAKANTTGIALAGGAASTGLLGDLVVTGATTAADTFIDGDTENFGKNLSLNAAFDLVGHGAGKLLRNIDWGRARNSVELIPDNTKANVSEYINTVDDALLERQPLTTNKSKQFWDGTSESKLTDAEKAGIPKGERNQPISVRTPSQEFSNKYISSKMSLRKSTYDYEDLTENYFRDVSADEFNKRLKEYVSYARRKGSPITNEIAEPIVKGYRNYLHHLDFDAKDLSDEELRIILSKHFADLSRGASGKMKDQIVWHSSPTWFDEFDYRYTGKNMENSGAMGPGNYFSKEATMYGRGKKGEFSGKYDMGNTQPYIITDVMSTPSGKDMQNKGLLPTIIHKYRGRDIYGQKWNPDPEFDIKLKAQIDAVPLKDNKMYVLEGTDSGFDKLYQTPFGLPGGELMIRRNTGIKSLYPHPSRFVRDADGFVHLIPVDWNDARVNFKKGGKL